MRVRPCERVSSLKATVPLAWRLLGRVQCRCPLHDGGCAWKGDYSEVTSHLTNSQSHLSGQDYSAGPDSSKQNAEALKDQGNAKFQQHAYQEAIQLYSKVGPGPGTSRDPTSWDATCIKRREGLKRVG